MNTISTLTRQQSTIIIHHQVSRPSENDFEYKLYEFYMWLFVKHLAVLERMRNNEHKFFFRTNRVRLWHTCYIHMIVPNHVDMIVINRMYRTGHMPIQINFLTSGTNYY